MLRAIVSAAQGQWDEARRNVKEAAKEIKQNSDPGLQSQFSAWLQSATGPMSHFLDQTKLVLYEFPVPAERRMDLLTTLLGRLSDDATVSAEGLSPETVVSLRAWTHYSLAELFAAQENREQVVSHIDQALALNRAGLHPDNFRQHGVFGAWNEDPEFVALYQRHEAAEQTGP